MEGLRDMPCAEPLLVWTSDLPICVVSHLGHLGFGQGEVSLAGDVSWLVNCFPTDLITEST